MAPLPTADELWGVHLMPQTLVIDVLMPNGLLMGVNCTRESTLESIKRDIFRDAKTDVMYRLLGDPNSYIFVSVTHDSKVEEFYDESRRICDLRLFQAMVKLIEPEGNKEEKMIASQIGLAIGRPVYEYDSIRDNEVIDFRRNVLTLCKTITEMRDSISLEEKAFYAFSPELDNVIDDGSFAHDNSITINCWLAFDDASLQNCQICVKRNVTPKVVIYEALNEIYKCCTNLASDDRYNNADENKDIYVLKICGIEQYLLGNHCLFRYKYIRTCISRGNEPQLMLIERSQLHALIPKISFLTPSFLRRGTSSTPITSASHDHVLPLSKADSMLRIRIVLATYVNVKDIDQIYVRTGIFHGTEALCESKNTKYVLPQNPRWDEVLEYELYVPDIPRSARLCLSICAVNYRKKREEHCAIAWGNIQLFDYKSQLLSERIHINLWPMPKGHDELLNALGMVGSNPNKDSSCLHIEFDRFTFPVVFPSEHQIEENINIFNYQLKSFAVKIQMMDLNRNRSNSESEPTEQETDMMNEMLKRDSLFELSEQEKDMLWSFRNYISVHYCDLLPKLLDSVKWNSCAEVSQLYVLLKKWPNVKVETALELLDYKYADLTVRRYAIKCLDNSNVSDDLLLQYLLQLVHVLKREPYLDNELSQFLLRRALTNRRIGHFFFWHLKAEMHDPLNALRCGILLEAYCRGLSLDNLREIVKQVSAMEKLDKLNEILKERKDDTQKDRLRFLYETINRDDYSEVLQNLRNPLNNSIILGNVLANECRIMDSAKRPLWFVWSNPDPTSAYTCPTNAIIFKSGDDLRQDMLTLQVIRIMDSIWRRAELDLKMLPYGCLATGSHVGMIDVVRNAKTVMNIQRTGGRMAAFQVDSTQLHKWIKEKNKDDKYDRAVDNFMKSCAGYCVATFILGIGDRNPDNIMVNEDGVIFHIDFGHFLGHFKKKFGINRERVPFVLTQDFLHVISKGSENPLKSKEFETFQKMCGDAYLALHQNANLLITLFTMMLSTGIPELQSIDDIEYLRKTLAVEKNDADALDYFITQLNEAHGGAWSTKLDWFFHCIKHSSKV